MPFRVDASRVLIETDRLILRLPKRGDESALVRFYTDNRTFLQPFSPSFDEGLFTIRGWRDRIDSTLSEYQVARGLRLVMFRKTMPNAAIGVVNFTSITDFPTYMCNLGYSISQAEQNKGYMTEALTVATAYVFRALVLHRIEANYMPRNEASAKVLKKLGFVVEGEAKDYILINGKWEDHVRTSLTNTRWINR